MSSNHYQFQCPQCLHTIPLLARQAGQSVSCTECNVPFEAPRLGELKRLPLVESATGAVSPREASSMFKRWLFILGLGTAVLLGAAGAGIYQYASSLQQEINPEVVLADQAADIEGLTDAEVYQIASGLDAADTLGEYYQPEFIKDNKQAEILKYIAYGLLGLAGFGLLALIGSFFVK